VSATRVVLEVNIIGVILVVEEGNGVQRKETLNMDEARAVKWR
jgi:hypothetical protein